jgi:Alkaline phosphatase
MMKPGWKRPAIVALLTAATGAATIAGGIFDAQDYQDSNGGPRRAKNVILFIGDGMGVSTVTATRVYSVGVAGQLVVDQFPYTALSRTYSSDSITPDSAPTMTAMMTGKNTNAGVVYRDRAVGYLIDHDRREVEVHEESSLRSLMQILGWRDVLTLRFDPAVLPTPRATGERRQDGEANFKRYVANAPDRDGVVEVWWSEGLMLPLSLTVRSSGAEVTSVVKGLTWSSDSRLLAGPSVRYPTYKTVDPADANDHH